MNSPEVVIAQVEPEVAGRMAAELHAHFTRVSVAASAEELHSLLLRTRASIAVLDLELIPLDEVRQLARNFAELSIVCTHRAPDERTWLDSLNAGAADCCQPEDMRTILRVARPRQPRQAARAA
jgi:DNA-binding response OmpR family regulator